MKIPIVAQRNFFKRLLPLLLLSQATFVRGIRSEIRSTGTRRDNMAYIAIGSNVGDRVFAFSQAINILKNDVGVIHSTSHLYETPPMYYTDQPSFLNAMILIETKLSPFELLKSLKNIEETVGRQISFRNGPRLIDLDIIMYNDAQIEDEKLQIPHPRLHERAFVLKPLVDINSTLVHPILKKNMSELLHNINCDDIKRRWPIGNKLHDFDSSILLFGILNITPDSFSDGGQFYINDEKLLDNVLNHALHLINSGADVLDIGGESTRPGASVVGIDEEMNRVIPVIQHLRKNNVTIPISIDTRNSKIAEAAINCGANIINDVSGGKHDINMFPIASRLGVPIIIMHSRGTPATMSNDEHTAYSDVVMDVSMELIEQIKVATMTGVPKWHQWIDPGIGFAKKENENMKLLCPSNLKILKQNLEGRPMMIGASRKRFLSNLLPSNSDKSINDKDVATIGASCIAISGGASMLRVHNIRDLKIASDVYYKILNAGD